MSTSYLHTGIRRRRSASYARETHTRRRSLHVAGRETARKSRWAESENVVSRDGTEHRAESERERSVSTIHRVPSRRPCVERDLEKEGRRERETGRAGEKEIESETGSLPAKDGRTWTRTSAFAKITPESLQIPLSPSNGRGALSIAIDRWTIRVCVRRVMLRLVTLVSRWIRSLLSRHEVSQWRRVLFGRDFVPTTEQTLSLSLLHFLSLSCSCYLFLSFSVSLFLVYLILYLFVSHPTPAVASTRPILNHKLVIFQRDF